MITIRAYVYPHDRMTRDRITAPAVKVTARRASRALLADACEAFRAALAASLPHEGAHAHLEVSDRHGLRVLASYVGVVTHCRPGNVEHPCAPCGGAWRLERLVLEPGVSLPSEVVVGGPSSVTRDAPVTV